MSDPKLSSWTRWTLVEQPAILVSGLYLVASVIGLVYSWAFLHGFGINVFRYAEISDFLLPSLKEPFTWVLAIFGVAMFLIDNAMSRRLEARGCRQCVSHRRVNTEATHPVGNYGKVRIPV